MPVATAPTANLPAANTLEPTRFESHLNESDAILWNIERDPSLRTTIVAVSLLDRSPDWTRLRARVGEACQQVPRLRQKVVATPLRLGPPRWQDDECFDVDFHLRRELCTSPADLRSVLDLAGHMAMAAFDKDRPLWEFILVEGLQDGRAAFIQKVHHSFTDGVGGVKLAELLLDTSRKGPVHRPELSRPSVAAPSWIGAATHSVAADLSAAAGVSVRAVRAMPALAGRVVSRPDRALGGGLRGVRSIARLLAPARSPLSAVMVGRGLSRRLEAFDVPLDAMLAAAHHANSTLNDAFLASVTEGLRRYHEQHGSAVSALRVTMPINLRRPDDALGSNRFVPARLTIPIEALPAGDRMQRLGSLARRWRREPALRFTDVIAGVLNRLPVSVTTSVFGGMLKAIDFVATNVPGMKHRMYLAGAEVVREYAFAPPSGAAFSIALLSHGKSCCIGLNIDTTAVPDPDELLASIRAGFDDVLATPAVTTGGRQ